MSLFDGICQTFGSLQLICDENYRELTKAHKVLHTTNVNHHKYPRFDLVRIVLSSLIICVYVELMFWSKEHYTKIRF